MSLALPLLSHPFLSHDLEDKGAGVCVDHTRPHPPVLYRGGRRERGGGIRVYETGSILIAVRRGPVALSLLLGKGDRNNDDILFREKSTK